MLCICWSCQQTVLDARHVHQNMLKILGATLQDLVARATFYTLAVETESPQCKSILSQICEQLCPAFNYKRMYERSAKCLMPAWQAERLGGLKRKSLQLPLAAEQNCHLLVRSNLKPNFLSTVRSYYL